MIRKTTNPERCGDKHKGNTMNIGWRWLVPVLVLGLQGCSFSDSSKSSSDSGSSLSDMASSPSRWISDSSQGERQRYQNDVRDYTSEYVHAARGDLATFHARIARIAESYGVADWAEDPDTYVAIGQGLKKAGLKGPQYDAFKTSLGSTPERMRAIERGYR